MANELKKTFYNIMELTDQFNHAMRDIDVGGTIQNAATALIWQTRVNLAIAQQLAVISGHLGDLVAMVETSGGKKK